MNISSIIIVTAQIVWGSPLLIAFFLATVFVSYRLRFVQFRYFFPAVGMLFSSGNQDNHAVQKSEDLTAFQAFINTLGANIGNGSLGGVPVALCTGGPGAIFWLFVISTFAVALRYAEVYLGMAFIGKYRFGAAKGGPMLYLSLLPFGRVFAYVFALFCLGYAIFAGNIIQCNTVGVALERSWGVDPFWTACFVLFFIVYILVGGSQRIVHYLDMLVPFKVTLFLGSCCTVLVYNYQALPHALYLILQGVTHPQAFVGGSFGSALLLPMTVGLKRSILIHEAGLGTAAIAFGSTTGKHPVQDSMLSMLSVYINTHVICLLIALTLLSTGVWNNGETSSAVMVSAYETVFGSFAGWIISFLAINFGVSVLVSYAYLGRVCWQFLTGGKLMFVFPVIYAAAAFFGTYMKVGLVWDLADIVNAGLLVCNVIGLVSFIGVIQKGLLDYENQRV